ncbi:MAG: metal ABC transporter solute-binding protein, Zn/Mn family [Acidimicrobiia bacterium]
MSLRALLIGLAALSSCTASQQDNRDRPLVVVTTGIIGDVVANVGGDAVEVATLIPAGVDPHDFAPSAQQVASISSADFIFANGLGLEEGLIDLLQQAESEGLSVTYLAEEVDPIDGDPHFWHDPLRMSEAANLIVEALGQTSNYPAELEELDHEVEDRLSGIPAERRLLVTEHDSFDYFAARYGFEVLGTIIPGGGSLGSPSSADLAALVELIEQHGVPAIFVENTSSPELAEILASEVGRPVAVVELASDSLGEPGSETATYIDLVRFNADAIATALGGS